jgi:hypothetical protein
MGSTIKESDWWMGLGADAKKEFGNIFWYELGSGLGPASDFGVYVAFKGFDTKTAIKFEEAGGFVLSSLVGKTLAQYAISNDTLTSDASYQSAIKCAIAPVLSGIVAATGKMVMPGWYNGNPFEIFVEGAMITLLSNAITIAWKVEKKK